MAPSAVPMTPGLASFLKSIRSRPVETSIENLISLLKRRQIRSSRPCAIATAHLMRRVVATFKITDVARLIERVQQVGQRLTAAQPREIAVGNIVRRVLGVIREEAEEDRDGETNSFSEANSDSRPHTPGDTLSPRPGLQSTLTTFSPLRHGTSPTGSPIASRSSDDLFPTPDLEPSHRPPLLTSHISYAVANTAPMATSMFSLLSHPVSHANSPTATPGTSSPNPKNSLTSHALANLNTAKDLRAEVIEGIEEIIDELDQVDDQIAGYALEHIHSNEIILTHTSSTTVQKFLLRAATKRKFTVIHAESFPNNHEATHATVVGSEGEDDLGTELFSKPLTAAGITVIVIPDAAVFALMSRVNKVILGTHVVLANGGLVAAAGAKTIAQAARVHRTPVVVVTGVYKLSPIYPFDFESLIEYGDASKVFGYEDGDLVEKVDVENPLFDYVPAELVDLYITNLGGHAPSYLYRIVSDHYRTEDTNLAR
ncbi:GCD complex subunit gcd7 [Trapelia coarctata]|nr:GCD complex subunit gcd7 [Trapelia coarctata]